MDKIGVFSKSRNTIRTDLSLLLECLKFQMKCPDMQKQALLTIHSICERREDNVDLLREMGGVSFVYNLSKSSIVRSDVKETALFTLGTLAEANVYCKNYLCRKETFADLAGLLLKEDVPLTQKRVSVYLLSVLVANNKSGQTLSQTTGCLDILLDLFRTTSPLSSESTLRAANATQTFQLWASVSSALCGCVNNPQNEEGQRICVAAFAIIKVWLQQIVLPRPEIFQPICSFIAMTVANNSGVQESFSASGGLDTLALVLVRLASVADTSLMSCQLSVTISKTLSACMTENSSLASGLSQYGVVSHLFTLLASPHLNPDDMLSVLLMLGHCTEASVEHQSHLVQCGGLPLIITLLTEDTSEEVRRAATFILQTCKQATMSLGGPGVTVRQGEDDHGDPITNMEGYMGSARELLRRIDLLEKRQAKGDVAEPGVAEPFPSSEGRGQPSLPLQQKESITTIHTAYRQNSTKQGGAGADNNSKPQTVRSVMKIKKDSELKQMSSNLSMQQEKPETTGGAVCCSVCNGTGALASSHLQSLEGGREPRAADNHLFKPPASVRHSVPKKIKCSDEEELQDCEMSTVGKIRVEQHSLSPIRCAGCVLPFEEVTSRTFASLQSSCRHSCDMHKVLQEATERFRTRHCNLLLRAEYQDDTDRASAAKPQRSCENWIQVCLTPIRKGAGKGESSRPEHPWKKHNGFSLTPLHRGAKKETLTSHNKAANTETRGGVKSGHHSIDDEPRTSSDICSIKRKRKDFSSEEVRFLLCGVKTFGFSWNSILWSYPFQPGRTNVDLAKKYRRLKRVEV
ncbi:telomere repeats-binding bouquet formation protein 1 isoform X2 [Pseudoliparis swirei]|uniref:telomere repeats-binding bouquet formation protein 1 isoform X2 n=1 Tax=Pseudoliparis swirei TaxID=2059687 RepID=UPI0024BE2543|nr:telomere repeats-binding bouquet formation protein 1 isoform X2 [Pseudoliparis swirei]